MRFCSILALLLLTLIGPASANSRIKIDTVPAEYIPYQSTSREPVSLSGFHFEVSQTSGRARVVATYTYAENMIVGEDDGSGPQPTVVQLPGLSYDADNHAVVYESSGKRTVCAVVWQSSRLWGNGLKVKNTGSCIVSTAPAAVTVDDGWDIHNVHMLNVYFEVH